MSTSAITAIVTLSLLIISFIGYWIYLNHNVEDPIEKIIPPIKEYEPTPLMFIPPEEEPLLHAKCPNCGARMTSNTCEYCDMTFYPEPDKLYDTTKAVEDRIENRFEPMISRM